MSKLKLMMLLFLPALVINAQDQNLAHKLQRQLWYVKGDLIGGDSLSLHPDKPEACTGYLIFENNSLNMYMTGIENKFSCSYETFNDKIKLSYRVSFKNEQKENQIQKLYKIKASGRDLLLTPILESEFQQTN